MADACENDHQHRKHGGVRQQAKTGRCWHEVGRQQRGKLGHKKAALKLIAGGPSKINQPNSHPSNPIHKAVIAAAGKPQQEKKEPTSDQGLQKIEPAVSDETPQHDKNKTAVIIGVVGLVALVFVAWC